MEQRIQLSDHFGFGRLIRFTIPSILMMIFTSIYGVVDGYFVSNFVGKTPFAAVNFIMPFLMVVGAMGFMFGTGGSALIARIMGEGRREKAQEIFSLLIAATFVSHSSRCADGTPASACGSGVPVRERRSLPSPP